MCHVAKERRLKWGDRDRLELEIGEKILFPEVVCKMCMKNAQHTTDSEQGGDV